MTNPRQLQADPQSMPILSARAQALAQPQRADRSESGEAVLLFQLGADRFSLPADAARSVQPLERYTPLPVAPPWIVGLVNVRGRLLTLVDIRPLLSIPSAPPRAGALLVIVGGESMELGLLADAVIGVQRCSAQLAPQPANAPGLAVPWIQGVDESLSLRCDPALLFADPRLIVNDGERPAQLP